jgi:hypothetical protein
VRSVGRGRVMPNLDSKSFTVTVTFTREDLSELVDLLDLAESYIETNILTDETNKSGPTRKKAVERWFKHIQEWRK